MLTLSQGLTSDAFVSSRDIHRRNKKSCSLVSFSLAKDGLMTKALLNLLVLLVVLR